MHLVKIRYCVSAVLMDLIVVMVVVMVVALMMAELAMMVTGTSPARTAPCPLPGVRTDCLTPKRPQPLLDDSSHNHASVDELTYTKPSYTSI